MSELEGQPSSPIEGAHLVLYDGACGLCNGLIQFVLERDRRGLFHFASLQSVAARAALEPFGSNPEDLTTLYVLVNYRGPASTQLTKGRAALFVITRLGSPWRAASLLGVFPDWVLDRVYDVIARNRYRVFGRQERCLTPRPDYGSRFIDSDRRGGMAP